MLFHFILDASQDLFNGPKITDDDDDDDEDETEQVSTPPPPPLPTLTGPHRSTDEPQSSAAAVASSLSTQIADAFNNVRPDLSSSEVTLNLINTASNDDDDEVEKEGQSTVQEKKR